MDIITLTLARNNKAVFDLDKYGISLAAMYAAGETDKYLEDDGKLLKDVSAAFEKGKRCFVHDETFNLLSELTTFIPVSQTPGLYASTFTATAFMGTEALLAQVGFLYSNGETHCKLKIRT